MGFTSDFAVGTAETRPKRTSVVNDIIAMDFQKSLAFKAQGMFL